jgi:hypothetical protein
VHEIIASNPLIEKLELEFKIVLVCRIACDVTNNSMHHMLNQLEIPARKMRTAPAPALLTVSNHFKKCDQLESKSGGRRAFLVSSPSRNYPPRRRRGAGEGEWRRSHVKKTVGHHDSVVTFLSSLERIPCRNWKSRDHLPLSSGEKGPAPQAWEERSLRQAKEGTSPSRHADA